MEDNSLLRVINTEIENYKTKQIQIVPGFYFNQYDALNKIFFYYNSQFTSGAIDIDGDKKYFFNIVRNPCKVFTKAIDFDTKNIRLLTTGGGDPLKTWFMERDLKFWMRDKQFGKVLNRIFRDLPVYGSVVLKIVDGNPYFVDLRNFIVEQSADSLDHASYIIEIHNLTVPQFRKVGKEMKWGEGKIEETIRLFREKKEASHIRVYERYGEVLEGNTWKYKRVYWADVGEDEFDDRGNMLAEHPGVELSSVEVSDHPYWEFHKDKIPGRWLGVGIVEELFEPQIKQNEIANLQSKSASWKALVVFQTRDPGFNRNLKTGVQNGEVLNVDSEVTQVNIHDNNLAFFNEETQKWLRNRDELTFSFDPIQGERSPAGTPLGSTQLSVGQTLSYFEGIQEEIAMDIKEMLYQVIIPQFEKEKSDEHVIRLVGQDLETYIQMVKNDLVMKEIIRLSKDGTFINPEEKDSIELAVEASIRQEKEKLLTVPKGFYKDLKYDVDIDITGESVDTRVRYATRFAILQAITSDPTMTKDPVKKKILYGMAEDGGINPNDIFGADMEESVAPEIPGRAGGGVSVPNALNVALSGQSQGTI